MDCKEFEKRIPDFISRKMDYITLKRYMAHMESCPKCREELTIQVLLEEGLVRLEEGSAFDLKQELYLRKEEAQRKIKRNDRWIRIAATVEYLIMFGTAVMVMAIIGKAL